MISDHGLLRLDFENHRLLYRWRKLLSMRNPLPPQSWRHRTTSHAPLPTASKQFDIFIFQQLFGFNINYLFFQAVLLAICNRSAPHVHVHRLRLRMQHHQSKLSADDTMLCVMAARLSDIFETTPYQSAAACPRAHARAHSSWGRASCSFLAQCQSGK